MDDKNTSNDPRAALIVSNGVPVAVRDLKTLYLEIGLAKQIPVGNGEVAYRMTQIKHKEFKKFFGLNDHIWIDPSASDYIYKAAWKKANCNSPNGKFHLDHLHAKIRAIKEGYKFVVLYPCPGGPNSSAGSAERQKANITTIDLAHKKSVYHAEDIHFCKMWGCYQHLNRGMNDAEAEKLFNEHRIT